MIRTTNNQLHTYDIMYLTGNPKDKDRKAFTIGYIATEKPLDFGKDSEKGLVCNAVAEQWKSDFGVHVRIFPHISGYSDGDGILFFADFVRNSFYKFMLRNNNMVKSYFAMQDSEKEEHLSIAYTQICELMHKGENNPYTLYKAGKAAIERFRLDQSNRAEVKYSPDWSNHNMFGYSYPVNRKVEKIVNKAIKKAELSDKQADCINFAIAGLKYKELVELNLVDCSKNTTDKRMYSMEYKIAKAIFSDFNDSYADELERHVDGNITDVMADTLSILSKRSQIGKSHKKKKA